jgi:hypothetical protein
MNFFKAFFSKHRIDTTKVIENNTNVYLTTNNNSVILNLIKEIEKINKTLEKIYMNGSG